MRQDRSGFKRRNASNVVTVRLVDREWLVDEISIYRR